MKERKYSADFKQEILNKVNKRGKQSLPDFAQAHGINRYTLKNWLQESKQAKNAHAGLPVGLEAAKWDAAQPKAPKAKRPCVNYKPNTKTASAA
jgi:transposase-like protein